MKSSDVRKKKIDGEVYINIDDLISKINQHGDKISTAFTVPEFKNTYIMAYVHIEELLELIKEY